MNLLFCSAGRRAKLIQNAKKSIGKSGKVFATDNSIYAPAIYLADAYKIVPLINDCLLYTSVRAEMYYILNDL